ncbi:MAG: flagellar biosynthetic protein FliO [Gammaproteobacteria bacterium]|nr:flagellar biosynthetic protein FliO [Gammaproteobacteria bacterium]
MQTSETETASGVDAVVSGVPIVDGSELLSMGLSMVVVVAAILVLGWFFSRSRFAGGGASDLINIVAIRTLGPKERLLVIEVADQHLLIGMTSTAVQTLHVFDEPVGSAKGQEEVQGFASRLRTVVQEIRE